MSSIEGMAEQNVILVEKEVSTRFRLLSGLARESGGDRKIIVNKLQGFVETYQFKRIGIYCGRWYSRNDGWLSAKYV